MAQGRFKRWWLWVLLVVAALLALLWLMAIPQLHRGMAPAAKSGKALEEPTVMPQPAPAKPGSGRYGGTTLRGKETQDDGK
jgi:hypothetical protein